MASLIGGKVQFASSLLILTFVMEAGFAANLPEIRLKLQNELIQVSCPLECDPISSPVCGTNGQTFANECELARFACEHRQIVVLDHHGECVSCPDRCPLVLDPICSSDGKSYANECFMRAMSCETGLKMTVVSQGLCLERHFVSDWCQSHMCHSVFKPVCGSNGQTYRNKCFLQTDACLTKTEITVVEEGLCQVRKAAISEEECNFNCDLSYKPVCASDGFSYSNQCMMNVKACLTGEMLIVTQEGECPSAEAVLSEEECNFNCGLSYKPVCASDGETYLNKCLMDAKACVEGEMLMVTKVGECPSAEAVLSEEDCNLNCDLSYKPVCASDGLSYSNECMMNVKACLTGETISVTTVGECPTAEAVLSEEECNMNCDLSYKPVCASDGQMYLNKCLMDVKACINEETLTIIKEGECPTSEAILSEEDCNLSCDFSYKPVCASDGKTYINKCKMELVACTEEKNLEVITEGECKNRSGCKTACSNEAAPVCASDGVTYANPCLLEAYACLNNKEIRVKHLGQCI